MFQEVDSVKSIDYSYNGFNMLTDVTYSDGSYVAIYIDVYVNENFIDTIDYKPIIPKVAEYELVDALVFASQYYDYHNESGDYNFFKEMERNKFSNAPQYMYFCFDVKAEKHTDRYILIDYLYMEFVKDDTDEVVKELTINYDYLDNESTYDVHHIMYKTNGTLAEGEYTLKIYTERDTEPILTKPYIVTKN